MGDSIYKSFANSPVAFLIASLLIGSALLFSGCATPAVSVQPPSGSHVELARNKSSHVPALYAVFDDKSGSVKSARLAPLQEQDLVFLIDILRQTGGELAFGLIGESSDRPLVRLRLPVPPTPPVKPDVQNPFERAEQDSAFKTQASDYNTQRQRWESDSGERINAFLSAVRPRLQQPARESHRHHLRARKSGAFSE